MDHINQLPAELLCMIFDRVDDCKHVALVCRRWNDILFHTPYIDRFRLVVDAQSMGVSNAMGNQPGECLPSGNAVRRQRRIMTEATESNRRYRRVRWLVEVNALRDHRWILRKIVPPHNHLVQLLLTYDNTAANDLLPALAKALPNMQRLRMLTLVDESLHNANGLGPPITLASASVQQLELSAWRGYPLRVTMPSLQRFVGQYSCYPYGALTDEPVRFFDECHRNVRSMVLEVYSRTQRLAVIGAWDQLALFPNLADLKLLCVVMDDAQLERLLAVPLPSLRSISFFACLLSANGVNRIYECIPSTVLKLIIPRAISPFLE